MKIALIAVAIAVASATCVAQTKQADCRPLEFAEIQTLSDKELEMLKAQMLINWAENIHNWPMWMVQRCQAEQERLQRIYDSRMKAKHVEGRTASP